MKEKYFRYTHIALLLLLGYLIISGLWQFINGLLGAFTVYVIVRRQMKNLTERRKFKNIPAATLILLEVIACVFIPLYFLVWALVDRIQLINFDISQLIAAANHFVALIQEKIDYNILSTDNIATATGYLTKSIQFIISQLSGIIVSTIVTLFLLYFMLLNMAKLEAYIYNLLPFNDVNKKKIRGEIHNMVRSNAIGIPLLAIIQGFLAFAGYWIAGAPAPLLLGVATAFATIIPLVGTGLVWLPVSIYLALTGNWIAAIALAAYCLIIITNIDNVIRLVIQKKLSDTHPLITVFGVILGLKIFGFWGIIFGPLLISMFFLLLNLFYEEYIDNK